MPQTSIVFNQQDRADVPVLGLALSAAATYALRNIRVNCVAPGSVDTPLAARITSNEPALKASTALHALGRIGRPEDVASGIAWLLDPANSWVTGLVSPSTPRSKWSLGLLRLGSNPVRKSRRRCGAPTGIPTMRSSWIGDCELVTSAKRVCRLVAAHASEAASVASGTSRLVEPRVFTVVEIDKARDMAHRLQRIGVFRVALDAGERRVDFVVADEAIGHRGIVGFRQHAGRFRQAPMAGLADIFCLQRRPQPGRRHAQELLRVDGLHQRLRYPGNGNVRRMRELHPAHRTRFPMRNLTRFWNGRMAWLAALHRPQGFGMRKTLAGQSPTKSQQYECVISASHNPFSPARLRASCANP